jgi:hypothetical protein
MCYISDDLICYLLPGLPTTTTIHEVQWFHIFSFFWIVSIIIEQQIMLINCRLMTTIVMYNIYIYSFNHLTVYTLGVWSWNRIAWMIINVTTTLCYQQVPLSKVHVILLLSDGRHPPSHLKSLSHERWNLF